MHGLQVTSLVNINRFRCLGTHEEAKAKKGLAALADRCFSLIILHARPIWSTNIRSVSTRSSIYCNLPW